MESNLARSLILAGKKKEGRAIAERLAREGLAFYRLATLEEAMGENEKAVIALEKAFQARDPWLVVLKVDPMLETARKDKRVREIEREVFRG
jgi:precorrin-6B methylase 1